MLFRSGGISWALCLPSRSGHTWFTFITTIIIILMMVGSPGICKKTYDSHKGQSYLSTMPEWSRRKSKNSECRLGGIRHPLNATWSPDLGPPFGVWSCVQCTCTPVQKKRRIVAKVVCKNIKTLCPREPKCEKPILPPGACCKICPGGKSAKDDGFVREEEEERDLSALSKRDFAVLLNGRTSRSPLTTRSLATGRILLRRGTLHFSFIVAKDSPPFSTVQFLSNNDHILEEIEVQPTPYEVNNGRICGTWTRVPRQYRNLLLKEELWVALLPNDDTVEPISGRVTRYKGIHSEVFSALLAPANDNGNETLPAGGTAIISVSAPSDSLHVSLVFNGIFRSNDERNVSVVVELRPSRALHPVRDTIFLRKVFSDVNEAELMTTLGETSLRLLTRGKVAIRVWSTSAPEMAIEGMVTSRATCNVYHAVLTAAPDAPVAKGKTYGAGWGLLFLSNEGHFDYHVRLEGLSSEVEEVVLQTATKRRVRHVDDLTYALSHGWVNGTYGKPTYRDLDALLRDHLLITVILKDGFALKGAFEAVSVTEALRSLHPALLMSPFSWLAASAWVAVDADCVMHYDVRLAGVDPAGGYDPMWSLQLREDDKGGPSSWDPRLDLTNVTLEDRLTGRKVASHTTFLTKVTLSRLAHGVTFLDLTVSSSPSDFVPTVALSGRLTGVVVPDFCLQESDGVPGAGSKKPLKGVVVEPPCKRLVCLDEEEAKPRITLKCIDADKKVYVDGTTWKSPVNDCARCMCTLGKIKCEDEPCPKPSCPNAVHLSGQCCPSCPVVSGTMSERVCKMDEDFHIIGAFWHPFLAPNGFDKCVTCYCNITKDAMPIVECTRVACPHLNCVVSDGPLVGKACCPTCSSTPVPPRLTAAPTANGGIIAEGQMADVPTKEQILADGGCLERKIFFSQHTVRSNGDVWFPKLSSHSARRCVSCRCQDGEISCEATKCSKQCRGKKCRKRNRKRNRKAKFLSWSKGVYRKKESKPNFRKRRLE